MIIDEIFKPLIGKYCWSAQKGYGSFLTFEFGDPHVDIYEKYRTKDGIRELRRLTAVHGDWHLWIYLCDWVVYTHGKVKAKSSSRTRDIDRAMGRLDGQTLVSVDVETNTETRFVFELGDTMETTPNISAYGNLNEQWLLYEHSGNVFTLRDDLKYSYKPGNIVTEQSDWLPLS